MSAWIFLIAYLLVAYLAERSLAEGLRFEVASPSGADEKQETKGK